MKQLIIALILAIAGGIGHIIKVVVFDVPEVKAETRHNKELLILIHEDVKFIKDKIK